MISNLAPMIFLRSCGHGVWNSGGVPEVNKPLKAMGEDAAGMSICVQQTALKKPGVPHMVPDDSAGKWREMPLGSLGHLGDASPVPGSSLAEVMTSRSA